MLVEGPTQTNYDTAMIPINSHELRLYCFPHTDVSLWTKYSGPVYLPKSYPSPPCWGSVGPDHWKVWILPFVAVPVEHFFRRTDWEDGCRREQKLPTGFFWGKENPIVWSGEGIYILKPSKFFKEGKSNIFQTAWCPKLTPENHMQINSQFHNLQDRPNESVKSIWSNGALPAPWRLFQQDPLSRLRRWF